MTKKSLYTTYYTMIALFVGVSLCSTLFQASQGVYAGQRVAELERTKQQTLLKQQALTTQLAQTLALQQVSSEAKSLGFVELGQPIALTDGHALATR